MKVLITGGSGTLGKEIANLVFKKKYEVNILTRWRVTSTFELLKNVENVYLLVTGDNKKEVIEKIGKENDLPVNELIRLRKKTVLLTDQ